MDAYDNELDLPVLVKKPRGWKASELAEKKRKSLPLVSPSEGTTSAPLQPLWNDHVISGLTLFQFFIGVVLIVYIVMVLTLKYRDICREVFRWFDFSSRRRTEAVMAGDSGIPSSHNDKENSNDSGACSCSNNNNNNEENAKKHAAAVVVHTATKGAITTLMDDSSEVISRRIDEATATLTSIQSKLPEAISSSERMAMTQMVLDAMKVNESCKATHSMQRMEHIAQEGNEIQSDMYDMKKKRYEDEELRDKSRKLGKMVVDIMCTGVACMVLSGAASAWYMNKFSVNRSCMYTKHQTTWGGLFMPMGFMSDLMMLSSLAWCYIIHYIRVVQACLVLLTTPFALSKIGMFQNWEEFPVFKVMLSCSILCGISGTYAVHWLGGHGFLWLALWQIWILSLLGIRATSYTICQRLYRTYGESTVTLTAWIGLGFVYPILLMGQLPFIQLTRIHTQFDTYLFI